MCELAYCGLKCNECPVFISWKTDDNLLRDKIAAEWGKLYGEYIGKSKLDRADMNCSGCKSVDDNIVFIGCKNCVIRRCAIQKNVANCRKCIEFDTCEIIKGFHKENGQALSNLMQS
jgi:hypothetical protein